MQLDQAINYAKELAVLKFPPSTPEALAKVGEIIADICRNQTEAEWLVSEMLSSFDEWPGPRMLKSVYDSKFGKSANREFPGLGTKPPIDCQKCGDNGYVVRDDHYSRCGCPGARTVTERFLEMLNGKTKSAKIERGERPMFTKITQADVDAAMLAVKGSEVKS